uniref:Uncharacterized protein n=1 Tax=Marseillevirus sp. TaxID=2809551 RepID=A0AA96IZ12_9VIRU|nr:hypothetical protein MarDSR_105 [Marseillevirus sp.]
MNYILPVRRVFLSEFHNSFPFFSSVQSFSLHFTKIFCSKYFACSLFVIVCCESLEKGSQIL